MSQTTDSAPRTALKKGTLSVSKVTKTKQGNFLTVLKSVSEATDKVLGDFSSQVTYYTFLTKQLDTGTEVAYSSWKEADEQFVRVGSVIFRQSIRKDVAITTDTGEEMTVDLKYLYFHSEGE